jgi:cytochrome o ubiquinol oxidase subunit II
MKYLRYLHLLTFPILALVALLFGLAIVLFMYPFLTDSARFLLLESQGYIAIQESKLLTFVGIALVSLALPVVLSLYVVLWKYRDGKSTNITHQAQSSEKLSFVWWGILGLLFVIFSVIVWQTTHHLDPHNALPNSQRSMTIQVVSLQWKWLFIYPEQKIATVNYVEFPQNTQITFVLTADSPMNSFWIPQLGGQKYAMNGMVNKMNLIADKTGEFPGSTAEISGEGFAGMRFVAKSTTSEEFEDWVSMVKQSKESLDQSTYEELAKPSEKDPVTLYGSVSDNLYNEIVMKYMHPIENQKSEARNVKH